jgi:tol-pal system protein YbgF
MRPNRLIVPLLVLSLASPAFAGTNKDMIQLQTQIQELQDAVARLQQSNDERMGVLKDLVQQSADSVNRLSVNMDTLQKQLIAQQTAEGAKVDTVSGQVQALNDSLDEMKARMNRLEKAIADLQGTAQNISAALQNLPQNGSQPGTQPVQPSSQPAPAGQPPVSLSPSNQQSTLGPQAAAAPTAPPVDDLYKAALGDYMAAKYTIASSEFGDVIKNYPDNNLAGNAFYYMAEIDYRAGRYAAAAKDYDKVLEQFPDSQKIPASRLHKGEALIAMHQNEAGIRELRSLIQRYPASPEATQARSKLNGMGVPIRPRVQ